MIGIYRFDIVEPRHRPEGSVAAVSVIVHGVFTAQALEIGIDSILLVEIPIGDIQLFERQRFCLLQHAITGRFDSHRL